MLTVVAAVIERNGNVLVAQRKRTRQHALQWEFPGGKVEAGETPEQAVIRELREELGIQAQAGAEILRYEFQYEGRPPILLMFFRVVDFSGEPRNLDFEQLLWIPRDRLRDYDFLEGDTQFLNHYLAE